MYSAVLMLALTAGNESVDFGRNRCHGSGASCSATAAKTCTTAAPKSSSASSCTKERHRLFGNRCHGCTASTGCTKTVAAAPAPAPTCSKSHGCTASRCSGGSLLSRLHNRGCASTRGCAATGATEKKKEMPKGEKVAPPKGDKKPVNAPATISEGRTMVTPELDFGSTYVYTMRAGFARNGR
ncbi:MAG: hypothetical protein EXR98_14915 [Gemmataceae bacterium]|nr:hypothetical protein [Gemmataceae bacterium]